MNQIVGNHGDYEDTDQQQTYDWFNANESNNAYRPSNSHLRLLGSTGTRSQTMRILRRTGHVPAKNK